MELKVWVDGIQRIVCGVSETTSCQDVVYALAHATGRTGRFTLIERWRNNERLLAPQELPVKVLMKWGEYSSDVQFILLRSPLEKSPGRARRAGRPRGGADISPPSPETSTTVLSPELQRRRSELRLLEHVKRGTVGVVRGVQQRPPDEAWSGRAAPPPGPRLPPLDKPSLNDSVSSVDTSFNTSHDKPPPPPPPPPHSSQILAAQESPSSPPGHPAKSRRPGRGLANDSYNMEEVVYNNQYRELLSVVNAQKTQLSSLQADVTKCDAEIVYLEEFQREQDVQLSAVRTEANRLETVLAEQHREVSEAEETAQQLRRETEEGDRMRADSELLKQKLAACEADIKKYDGMMRDLSEAVKSEQARGEQEARITQEELAELGGQLEQLQQQAARAETERAALEAQIAQLAEQLRERQRRVEQLLEELKTVNLESLRMAGAEELTKITEGPAKSGLSRQLIGSPRQLESAVPTSKNPHGVWV
ncbi:ras association domain-containing protein 7-like [Pollicipes pollicipes]|uniref:ras association domain-containing protein 7-like n=1 Tax=Pollicipes pollicipes TaxID=41117 RepID=UPI001884D53C|nr:ras association domain-containing protein 7-like [Pollicipes pollicipes]